MSGGAEDRPQPRERGPRPAPAGPDPARPAVSALPTAPAVRRRSKAVVQLNTRVEPLLDELVALVVGSRGMSKRDVVENALKVAYPAEYQALVARERASELGS